MSAWHEYIACCIRLQQKRTTFAILLAWQKAVLAHGQMHLAVQCDVVCEAGRQLIAAPVAGRRMQKADIDKASAALSAPQRSELACKLSTPDSRDLHTVQQQRV